MIRIPFYFPQRYRVTADIHSRLDPIEDLTALIAGFRSIGYTSDVLSTVHCMQDAEQIGVIAKEIKEHIGDALGLVDQANAGPPEVSFLPLYYAILNLSKVCILTAGHHDLLLMNRHHGASYDLAPKGTVDLLGEKITLHPRGVLSLFYTALTGESWPVRANRKFELASVYSNISAVAFEYNLHMQPTGAPAPLAIALSTSFENDQIDAVVGLLGLEPGSITPTPEILQVLRPLGFVRDITYESEWWQESETNTTFYCDVAFRAKIEFSRESTDNLGDLTDAVLRTSLLYSSQTANDPSLVARAAGDVLIPEELPIWLACFHLSNVVRYDPERLHMFQDSNCWPMLLALGRHGLFTFLTLFWSFMHQRRLLFSYA